MDIDQDVIEVPRLYQSTALSCDVRNAIGRIGVSMQDHAYKYEEIKIILKDAGFDIPKSTFHDWCSAIRRGVRVGASAEFSGRYPILSSKNEKVLHGWVLQQNIEGKIVHLKDVAASAGTLFNITISLQTAQSFLHNHGFASHRVMTRAQGYKLTDQQLSVLAKSWLNEERDNDFFDCSLWKLGCVDFSYSSQRTHQPHTYSQVGRYLIKITIFSKLFISKFSTQILPSHSNLYQLLCIVCMG